VTLTPGPARFRRAAATAAAAAPALAVPVFLVAIGAILRMAFLGEPQLFRDEAASWLVASYPFGALLDHASHETYPPLYQVLLKGWLALFGEDEAALRSLSVVVSLAGLVAAWRWAHEALGRLGGLMTLAIVAVSPLTLTNAHDARMYALEATFATVAWWLAWRLAGSTVMGRREVVTAVGLGLAVGGEVWTLSLGLPTAALQLLFVSGCWAVRRRRGPGLAVLAIVAGLATLAPWLPALLGAATSGARFWTPKPDLATLAGTFGDSLLGGRGLGAPSVAAACLMALAVVGLVFLLARRLTRGLGLALALGVALVPIVWLYSQIHSIYDPRYLGAALPPLAIAASAGLVALDCRFGERLRVSANLSRAIAPAAAAVLVLLVAVSSIGRLEQWRAEAGFYPARQTVAELRALVRPGDVILSMDARSYFPLAYLQAHCEAAGCLPAPLYDWEGPGQPFYRGSALLDSAVVVDRADVDRLGWPDALPGLSPNGTIWLVELARPDHENLATEVARSGELIQTESIPIEGNGFDGHIFGLRLP
jgi:hypothetical protein